MSQGGQVRILIRLHQFVVSNLGTTLAGYVIRTTLHAYTSTTRFLLCLLGRFRGLALLARGPSSTGNIHSPRGHCECNHCSRIRMDGPQGLN
ncbi:unnamed protein product [Arctogadus glacialis]